MDSKNSVWCLLKDLSTKSGITEIIINNTNKVFIEREGELIHLNTKLTPQDIVNFCKDVAKLNNSEFGTQYPILDGKLPDGSRINVISSLYTGASPAITIRKYLNTIKNFEDSPGVFGLSEKWVSFLKTLVKAKMNIIVSGGTGSGKTTMLNLLLQEVGTTERVITIEDTKELSFDLPNIVRLVAQKDISKVVKPLKIRDLLHNTLRMRPDRIIIGEVRGEEAFDLLQIMNTGHDGSMCTIHSNSPAECLSRLENLFLFAGFDVPLRAVRSQMSTAIDFIIQLDRNRDGTRVVSRVAEVSSMEGDTILIQDLGNSVDGQFVLNGLVPKKMPELLEFGLSNNFFL